MDNGRNWDRDRRGLSWRAVLAGLVPMLVPFSLVFVAGAMPSRAGDARAAGMGEAYAALARGPLAFAWNPAGILTTSGVQGSVASGFFPGGSGFLLLGAAVGAEGGPAIAWGLTDGEEGGSVLGTIAFAPSSASVVGASVAYQWEGNPTGMSLRLGWRSEGEGWAVAASALDVAGALFGAGRPPQFLVGVALQATEVVMLELDLHVLSEGTEIALGAVADLRFLAIRWGAAVGIDGGLRVVGLGAGVPVFGQQVDVALLLVGKTLEPSLGLGVEARLPAWW